MCRTTVFFYGEVNRSKVMNQGESLLTRYVFKSTFHKKNYIFNSINEFGLLKSLPLFQIATEIFWWAEQNLLSLTASYLPGVENSVADGLSRHFIDHEWSLNSRYLQEIFFNVEDTRHMSEGHSIHRWLLRFFLQYYTSQAVGQHACLSPYIPNYEDNIKDPPQEGGCNCSHSLLAQLTMVPTAEAK